jgi:regulatory protein
VQRLVNRSRHGSEGAEGAHELPDAGVAARPGRSLRQLALAALARREHSRSELEKKLRRHAHDDDELRMLLDEFEANGWLSDERFATGAARHRQGRFSQRYIVEDLKQRGVGGDAARAAVDALGQDDYASAFALWRQRFGKAPADQKEKARQVRFLQARGFALSIVFRVLKEAGARPEDGVDA